MPIAFSAVAGSSPVADAIVATSSVMGSSESLFIFISLFVGRIDASAVVQCLTAPYNKR
jgi:hypothetical protein